LCRLEIPPRSFPPFSTWCRWTVVNVGRPHEQHARDPPPQGHRARVCKMECRSCRRPLIVLNAGKCRGYVPSACLRPTPTNCWLIPPRGRCLLAIPHSRPRTNRVHLPLEVMFSPPHPPPVCRYGSAFRELAAGGVESAAPLPRNRVGWDTVSSTGWRRNADNVVNTVNV